MYFIQSNKCTVKCSAGGAGFECRQSAPRTHALSYAMSPSRNSSSMQKSLLRHLSPKCHSLFTFLMFLVSSLTSGNDLPPLPMPASSSDPDIH